MLRQRSAMVVAVANIHCKLHRREHHHLRSVHRRRTSRPPLHAAYCFFNFLNPIVTIVFSFLAFRVLRGPDARPSGPKHHCLKLSEVDVALLLLIVQISTQQSCAGADGSA